MFRSVPMSDRRSSGRVRLLRLASAVGCLVLHCPLGTAQEARDYGFDAFGRSLARVDDLDCDGIADFAVGDPCSKPLPGANHWTPRVFLYSGRAGLLIRELTSTSVERIGLDVASATDIDGDGLSEIVSGRVVFSGFDGREILAPRIQAPRWSNELFLAPPSPVGESKAAQIERLFSSPSGVRNRAVLEAAFELVRPHEDELGRLGWWPSASVSLPSGAVTKAARLTVERLLPEAGSVERRVLIYRAENSLGSIVYFGECPERDFGMCSAWIGDVDQDGTPDFAISDFWRGVAQLASSSACDGGRVFIYSGRTGALLRAFGDRQSPPEFGFALAGGEDLDADGVPDLLIGTYMMISGEIAGFSGRDGSRIFRIVGGWYDNFGVSLSFLDDVDVDGVRDFAASSLSLSCENCASEVIVYSGRTREVLYRVHSPYRDL